jgi:hypothetical protein
LQFEFIKFEFAKMSGWPFAPGEVERAERAGAENARKQNRMPDPSGKEWDAIRKHYALPEPKKVDSVLFEVTLPPKWKVKRDSKDPYGRSSIIYDHEGKRVGDIFLKTTSYDYYGDAGFDRKRLQELGIMKVKTETDA